MANQREQDQFTQVDFFNNAAGLNLTDSPFRVLDEQATGGYNYDYSITGGFKRRAGDSKLNSSADTNTQALGYGLLVDQSNNKTLLRAAGRKLQALNSSTYAATNLTEDTATAGSDFYPTGQTRSVNFLQFNYLTTQIAWTTGANATAIYGAYSATKATKNGSDAPTGSFSATVGALTGVWAATGTYYYAIALRKASTQAISNAALDISATVVNTTDKVTLDFTGLTGLDTTKYDRIYIYRSAVSGSSAFTAGSLVTTISSSTTTYVDTGTASATSQNIPRAGNTLLDNSVLPAGTYNSIASYKRRLVTATDSTIYFSDLNKPESWPTANTIVIPSGGPIRALATIQFNTPTASSADEFLAIFKDNELWMITGSSASDYSLQFIDYVGLMNQKLVTVANGYLVWLNDKGIYVWDGSGKPIYVSRPIEFQFSAEGTIDFTKLDRAWCAYYKKSNQVIWWLSDIYLGENKYSLKMDTRLTFPQIQDSLSGRILEGVFIQDKSVVQHYGGSSLRLTSVDAVISGDAAGNTYQMYINPSDNSQAIDFYYESKILDFGKINQTKRFHKVIVWVDRVTTEDLTLEYWVTYNINENEKVTLTQQVTDAIVASTWDSAVWDVANWDVSLRAYKPLVFNLQAPNEGDGLKIRIKQSDITNAVSIAGFSVFYTELGLRK